MKSDTLIIVYELAHVAEAERVRAVYAREGKPEPEILAIDAEVEEELTRRTIPFSSGKEYRGPVNLDRFFESDALAKKILARHEWDALRYRDVPMRILATFPLRLYAIRILYYAELFLNLAKATNAKQWIVCESETLVLPTSGVLARQEIDVVVRAAKLVGSARGITVAVHALSRSHQRKSAYWLARNALSRAAFEAFLFVYNALMRLFVRPHAIRIVASDYWTHLSSIFEHLPEADLVLYDRGEIREIPLRLLWRHRIRFLKVVSTSVSVEPSLGDAWRRMHENIPELSYKGLDLRPVYGELLDAFFADALPQAIGTIDTAYEVLHAQRPDALLLRASVSRQLHFAILAIVARELKIPSLEIQHGHEYVGDGGLGNERTAEYIAVYGTLSQKAYGKIGYSKEKLIIVGSPKFDVYQRVERKNEGGVFRLLHFVPWFGVGVSQLDSYDFIDYVQALGGAIQKVGGTVEVVLKMRPGRHREEYFHRILERGFQGVRHTIAQYESLESLFAATDAVVTGHSTAVLEAMSAGVPVILYGNYPSQIDRIRTQYTEFIEEGAAELARSPEELTTILTRYAADKGALRRLADKGHDSVNTHFLFDGDSGKRIAEFLKRL
jgi:glycosyltransferase involved in cell wall biosynthesis